VFHVFNNLIDIELPFVLENFIYNKNEIKYNGETVTDIDDFIYDYFSLYPEEQIFYHNICYHSKHIVTIIDIMKKNKDFIMTTPKAQSATSSEEYNIFLKSFEKLIDKSHYNNMKNSYEKDKANKTKTYNILTSKFYNTKLKAITALKTQHFAIPEIPSPQNETERNINTVIRVKNCFSEILYNIHNIPKKDFFGYKINSFDDFINALMEISKINYYILNDSVNTDWYILTLKTLIYKIPNEYKEDNYKKLFEELTQELQNSILKMDYDTMSSVVDSYRYLDKELKKSIQSVEDFETIDFNTTVQNFINNAKIEVYVKVSESETSKKKLDVVPNSPNVNLKEKFFDEAASINIIKKTKKGERELDLKPLIYRFNLEIKDNVPVYDLMLSSGSTDNIKPELVIKAFHEYLGLPEFDELSLDIQRVDMYTGEPDSFVSLGEIGDEH
jgi:hypothetical protein